MSYNDNDSFKQYNSNNWVAFDNEAELIKAAKVKDTNAFNYLFLQYAPKIYRYLAYFLTSSFALEAENMTSQVFVKAWQDLDSFDYQEKCFLIWLYDKADFFIIQQKAAWLRINYDEYSSKEPTPLSQPSIGSIKKTELSSPDDTKLSWYMFKLPQYDRLVIYLHYVEALEFDEIRRLLNVTQLRVQKLHQEALRHLAGSY